MRSINIWSLFPDVTQTVMDSSILRRAQMKGAVTLESSDLRQFGEGNYRAVDDTPFGGRQGMLFTAPVLEKAAQSELDKVGGDRSKLKILYASPRGIRLGQSVFEAFAQWMGETDNARIALVCGRYEGVDERFVTRWVDLEFSIGDFILTGGELPSLMFVDGLVRLLPGVLGDDRSAREESFSNGLLEHPQYTKPRSFEGLEVPGELLNGNHGAAAQWKLRESLLLTAAFRPDLIRAHRGAGFPYWAQKLLEELQMRLDLRT